MQYINSILKACKYFNSTESAEDLSTRGTRRF